MNYRKMMLVALVLLAVLTIGAVSASEDVDVVAADSVDEVSVDASLDDEIISEGGGDLLASSDSGEEDEEDEWEEDDWILDYNSDLISFRELVTLTDRYDSGRLEINDSNGFVLFSKNVNEMEPNHGMKGYKYDEFRGYVVFKEDLNTTETGVYDLTITYYDDENEIVKSVNTTVYLDYTSYVTDDEIDVLDYDSTIVNFYVFNVMNNGSIEINIIKGEDDDGVPFIHSTFPVEEGMIDHTLKYTRQDFNLSEGIYTVRVRYVPNDEDPNHYLYYWKYTYFHDARVSVVDNTKFRARMVSESILDENSRFLVYCPENSLGHNIRIEIVSDDDSHSIDYQICESGYNNFTLTQLGITVPGPYAFNVYDSSGTSLIETYEYEIGNPLYIPDVCVLGTVGLERTMVAVLYIDMIDGGRLVLTDGDGVDLFNETLTDSYYNTLGYDRGYYILYSDFDPELTAGTYNITASYYINDVLRLTSTAEIRIVERNYVEDNDTGVGIELYDYYDHNLNDEEDSIAWVSVPEYESGYVTVVLMDDENVARYDFTFDEIDDDDGLPTFFISLFDREVDEGDYLVNVTYFDGDDQQVLSSSAWMAFYYRGDDEDDDGPIDWIEFDIIGNDDGEATFGIGGNVHVASLLIPDNEEYADTVATITVTKNYEPFATFSTSDMESFYREDKDANEYQIYLDLNQLNDKDIIEINVDCFDENGRIWTYAIELDDDNAIFHEYHEAVEYYIFYGNATTGDLNNPELMGPRPNGNFIEFAVPDAYNVNEGSIVVSDGETELYSKSFDEFVEGYNYVVLGKTYTVTLDEVGDLMTLLPENAIVTVTLNYGSDSLTFKRIRIGDYVSKVVTPDDVAALYEISVTDDGIFDENEIVVNIAATEEANRQSIYIDIGGGHFSIYVNDEKVENLGEMLLYNWIYESDVLYANPEELEEMGINEEVDINPYEFAELSEDEKVDILYDTFAGEFGSELELFRMTSYNFGCPELYLSAADLGIDQTGTYNIKITHIPDVYEPEPGFPADDYVYYAEEVIVDVDVPVEFESEETVLSADDLEMCYKDGSAWTATLTGPDGNPIVNAPVKIGIVGKVYTIKTNSDGVASLPINLGVGVYDVNATYEADDGQKFVSAVVTVKNPAVILSADDLVMIRSDGSAWTVTLTDPNGNPLANTPLKVGIVGKVYTLKTNDSGVARLPISLVVGVYEVNATFEGNNRYSGAFITSTVTVNYPSVVTLSADDLVMCYKDGSAWNVVLKNASGKPIANSIVKIGIVNKVYNIRTDANGVASLPINLGVGVYEVNASFKGTDGLGSAFINATITVNNPAAILTGEDLVMTYQDGSSYSVTLTNPSGNAIKNTVVKITICGKTYERTTDSNGVATLPINLRAGTYEISAKFEGNSRYSGVEITNTIIVNRP